MSAETRTRHEARYCYPGFLFPEELVMDLGEKDTLEAAVQAAPAEPSGLFATNGWYAVHITAITEKRYVAGDGEDTWVRLSADRLRSYVVGDKIHADDIEATEQNRILIANIRANSDTSHGVLTRCGNWQIADDYDQVVPASEVTR